MQDTLSDEKEFSGLIIGGADAALLLRVCNFHVAASRSHCLVQGMSPWQHPESNKITRVWPAVTCKATSLLIHHSIFPDHARSYFPLLVLKVS
jgi:hypothetical protein